jgi:catechol 2,3-dioxygenase-like lactoylglutathione lyase family enzyme
MASGIDHVAIAVADPDTAAAELTDAVGLAFTGGGRHAGLGTFNRLAFLGDAYLELIGVDDPAAAQGWSIGRAAVVALGSGGGFATYGLVDDGIRATVARLVANGSSIGPVVAGSRERPDGEEVAWWSAAPPMLGPDHPPFLIKHAGYGAEWGTEALALRREFVHPIGSPVRLLGLEIAVDDPVSVAAQCRAQVGLEFQAVGGTATSVVGPHVIRLVPRSSGPHATVTLGAGVGAPRTVTMLNVCLRVAT